VSQKKLFRKVIRKKMEKINMFAPCAKCKKDTFGTRRIQIIITKSTGKLEWLPFWFHYECLRKLWDFKRFIDVSILVNGNEIFRKV